jgi:ComF family protein
MLRPAQTCLSCKTPVRRSLALCENCEADLPWQLPDCQRCGVSLAGDTAGSLAYSASNQTPDWASAIADANTNKNESCLSCQQFPPSFDHCRSLFAYQIPVASMIKRFKDHAGFSEARCFGQLLSAAFEQYYLEQDITLPALLLPVPLHSTRIRQRGFNQAIMLCNSISTRTGITVLRHACERRPSQHSQRGLSAQARQLNMQGVFYDGKQAHLTAAKHIAIIDDVVTTTATVNSMSAVLRQQGAARIDVWSVARTN